MAKESTQHKLDRVRRPRVQITYDVETNGAMAKTELPFVVGVLADLSGSPKEKLAPMKQRKVVNIDRDNFNSVLEKATPRVAMKVDNKISGDGKLGVELNFKHMDDFEPAKVAEQVGPLARIARNAAAPHPVDEQDGRQRQAGRVARPGAEQHRSGPQAGRANGHRSRRRRRCREGR